MIGLDDLMTQARPIVEEIEFRKSAKPARREDDFLGVLADMIFDRGALIAGESQQAAAWGGVGALSRGQSVPGDELEQLLAAGEARRLKNAVEEAIRTGSIEGLKAFAPEMEGVKP